MRFIRDEAPPSERRNSHTYRLTEATVGARRRTLKNTPKHIKGGKTEDSSLPADPQTSMDSGTHNEAHLSY